MELNISAGLASQLAPRSVFGEGWDCRWLLCLLGIYIGSGEPKSGPQDCSATVLSTEGPQIEKRKSQASKVL